MPFLGQDWRSPGERWIRTDEGWQKMKIWRSRFLENLNESVVSRLLAMVDGQYLEISTIYQPYIFVPSRRTHENNISPTLCDGLNKLDIIGGVKDRRRQDYVWKLLQLLVKKKMSYMSGDAQRQLFCILEQLLNQVVKTQLKPLQMQKLLDCLKAALKDHTYDHLGSQQLWLSHMETVTRMQDKLNTIQIDSNGNGVTLNDLPVEVLRHIINCLSDHSDIIRIGMATKELLPLVLDKPLWRKMCYYHFNNAQIEHEIKRLMKRKTVDSNHDSNSEESSLVEDDWKIIYRNLFRQHGRKEDYVDSIFLCDYCSCLFWKYLGHPCAAPCRENAPTMVTPQDFINLFSV